MFRKLRDKIERALERREAARPLTRDDLQQLLSGMRSELIEMRSRIPRMEKQAETLTARAQQQIQRAEFAHRKAQEAESAGNAADAQNALEAARRALDGAEDMRVQAAEARAELETMKAEYAEKLEQLKLAERNKSVMLARSRRTGTAAKLDDLLRGPDSGIRRFERAEEDIESAEDLAAATRELEEDLGERPRVHQLETDYEMRQLEAARKADEIEERLAQLRRQVEEEDG